MTAISKGHNTVLLDCLHTVLYAVIRKSIEKGKATCKVIIPANGEPVHVYVCEGVPHSEATKIWMYGMGRLAHNIVHMCFIKMFNCLLQFSNFCIYYERQE